MSGTTHHYRITGHVQGVGFRAFVRDLATSHGWRGEVWNCGDGSVEAIIDAEHSVADVVRMLKMGPGDPRDVTWIPAATDAAGFRVGYTR